MKIFICGMDGYIGWALRGYLLSKGHAVRGIDSFTRRQLVQSLVPFDLHARHNNIISMNVNSTNTLIALFNQFKPDTIVHLAEIPSAPYSMRGVEAAIGTQVPNIAGTLSLLYAMKKACPEAHLIKLGSMGEYVPSSWYHLSKVHDSANIKWACSTYNLSCTDIMQGPVYGVGGRFDYDEEWGTVINRWVCMALAKHPLLIYGSGRQVRGYLPIQDSLRCIEIIARHRAGVGEYRVVNQFAKMHSLNELAEIVAEASGGAEIRHIDNPRLEGDAYEGNQTNQWLVDHGYEPTTDVEGTVRSLIEEVLPYASRIDASKFEPQIQW